MNILDMEFALVRRNASHVVPSIRNHLVNPGNSINNPKGEVIAWVFDGRKTGAFFPEQGTKAFEDVRRNYTSFMCAEGNGIPLYAHQKFVANLVAFQNMYPTQTTVSTQKQFPRTIDLFPITLRAIALECCSDVPTRMAN